MYLWPSRDGLGPFSHPNLTFLCKMRFKNNMRLENISVRVIDLVSLDLAPPFSLTRFRGRRQLPQAG